MRGFAIGNSPVRSVLCIGAHCDDIEIGCGGTVRLLAQRFPNAHFHWVTLSADPARAAETQAAATRLLAGAAHVDVRIEDFQGSYFPSEYARIKDVFESLKPTQPDLIFSHCRHDLHQDHRVVNELTWNTFRDHLVLEYEIPKFDGDLGVPNAYVPLPRAVLDFKCETLLACFPSQATRGWFTRSTFEAMARLRGIECNAPDGYAEAFHLRKAVIAI